MKALSEKFLRWNTLLLQYLRRDWKKILIWIIGLGLFSAGFIPAFEEITKDQGAAGMFETLKIPAMTFIVGPTPVETGIDYTLGAMYSHTMLLFCGLIAMVITALHIVGRTRKEEDLGRMELLRSFQIGRQANSLAAIKEAVIINILLAFFITGVMCSFGAESITTEGSLLFGASVGMAGIVGGAIALVMAQIMPSSSGATGSSLGIIGLLYILRASTDIANVKLSMLNPLGWTYLTNPYTENNWLPLLFAFVFSVALVIVAFALEGNRDLGAGYLPEKSGKANARKSLLSVPGLFLRIGRGVIIAWLAGYLLLGLSYGSIYGDMESFIKDSEILQQMFTYTGVSLEKSFTATIVMVMSGLVGILPVIVINKLFNVEHRLYISQLHATKVTRAQFYWTNIILAFIVGLLGVLLSAACLGGTALSVLSDSSTITMSDFLVAGLNFLPAVFFFTGLAALALGWAPRLGKVVYIYIVYSFMLNYFSGVVELPDWFLKTAIMSWVPRMPVEEFDVVVFVVITSISIAMIVAGYVGYKMRDMVEGS